MCIRDRFLSQAISVAFYVIAFAEAFMPFSEFLIETYPFLVDYSVYLLDKRLIGIIMMFLLSIIMLTKGANIGMNLLYYVVAILFASLIMFFMGKPIEGHNLADVDLISSVSNPDSFFYVFTIIFPAFTGIADIEIERTYKLNNIFLKIYVAKPGLIITESGSGLIDLTKKLKALLPRVNKISIDVFEIMEPDTHAILLAQFIANQLVRRVAFKRAVRKAIERAQANDEIQGIKVQVGGRLNGAEIARTEWVKEGRMPLQTLRAKIDYATASAKTIYGILGVKVWLFKGEAMS